MCLIRTVGEEREDKLIVEAAYANHRPASFPSLSRSIPDNILTCEWGERRTTEELHELPCMKENT